MDYISKTQNKLQSVILQHVQNYSTRHDHQSKSRTVIGQ